MKQISPDLLRRLRNDVDLRRLVQHLGIPTKRRGRRVSFRCPECYTLHATFNPYTNLGRCFRCQRNLNSIDLVMIERGDTFLEAVDYLERLLTLG